MLLVRSVFLLLESILWLLSGHVVRGAAPGGILLKPNIEPTIAKAGIYQQRLPTAGEPHELSVDAVEDLPSKTDLKIIVHGYRASRTDTSIKPLRNAYLAEGYPNVFIADWEEAAAFDYYTSRNAVPQVGQHFGQLLRDFMATHDIDPGELHIVGHSLGAHIAGVVGKYFNGTLGRITGLDPALPLFRPHDADSLQPTDARRVDVVHTDYPVFGDVTPRGTADFYPNFGYATQPGCAEFDLLAISKLFFDSFSCSHNRAVLLYAESVTRPHSFPTVSCSMSGIRQRSAEVCLRDSAVDGNAAAQAVAAIDDSSVVYMGEHVSRSAAGVFYLPTYEASPFGMGVNTRFST